MSTVVNNPTPSNEGNGGMGFFFGIVLLIIFGVLFFIYGLPYLGGAFQKYQAPQINVPGKIDVNINNK